VSQASRSPLPTRPVPVVRWTNGTASNPAPDEVAVEEPLEIRIDTRSVSVTLRTPGHDDELATGFLVSEGLIHRREDVAAIRPYPRNDWGNVLDVLLAPGVTVDFARLTRHVFAASSCGLCGKAGIAQLQRDLPPVGVGPQVSARQLVTWPDQLRAAQQTFDRTGGLHAAALFTGDGSLLSLREDIGRHNAVDKVVGRAFLDGLWPLDRHVLLVSGRTSFEIVQKAAAAGIAVIAAVSAPSSLAVEFAEANGQTLVGFLRDGRFNVYTHPGRISP
jgi:FdhD protein